MEFKPLVTLLAIVNPLACVTFFIHHTQGLSRRTVWIASVMVFVVIAASALLGPQILSFFGISLGCVGTSVAVVPLAIPLLTRPATMPLVVRW